MRKIDWEKPLTDDDLAFLRQAGIPGMKDRVELHQAQFDKEVTEPEVPEDILTRSALDPNARTAERVETPGAPYEVTLPEGNEDEDVEDIEGDDYDEWTKADLEKEVDARNALEGTSEVTIVGTGSNGNVTKPDYVKGLRLWDQENPDALK